MMTEEKKGFGASILAAFGAKQPEWSEWTPEQWAEHFRAQGPDDADDAEETASIDAVVTAAARRAKRAEDRKALIARNAKVREDKRRRKTPLPVTVLSTIPALARLEPEYVAVPFRDELDDAFDNMASLLKTGKESAFVADRRPSDLLFQRKGRPAIDGAPAILAYLERKFGLLRHKSPKGRGSWTSPGGAMVPEVLQIIGRVEPFIAACERGESCDWCPETPVTMHVGGALACAAHVEAVTEAAATDAA